MVQEAGETRIENLKPLSAAAMVSIQRHCDIFFFRQIFKDSTYLF
jgi:hypothetical protein